MRWGKFILVFQAIVTLVIGMAFLVQVIQLDSHKISQLHLEVKKGIILGQESQKTQFIDIKQRYSVASYVLLIVGLMEIMLISRLMV